MKRIIILFFATAFIFLSSQKLVFAAAESSCSSGQTSGTQTGCTDSNNASILSGQCTQEYGASSCGSMSSYLSALQSDCNSKKPDGIDCNLITQNDIYGREASAMANYLEDSAGDSTTNPGATSATNANMDCDSNGICYPNNTGLPDPSGKIAGILTNILYWLLSIFGILAIIAFAIAGVQYILSTGNEEMIDTAKRNMKWSIVGVIVALSGLVIVYAIDKMLRGYSNF